jgi:hypothetical protein
VHMVPHALHHTSAHELFSWPSLRAPWKQGAYIMMSISSTLTYLILTHSLSYLLIKYKMRFDLREHFDNQFILYSLSLRISQFLTNFLEKSRTCIWYKLNLL